MRTKHIVLILGIVFLSTPVFGQTIFEKIKETPWTGTGTLMNSPATYTMHWSQELDNAFYTLDFQNNRKGTDGNDITFKAKAYYKVTQDTIVSGTWFDARGVQFPLKGTVSDDILTIFWGSPETEQGKTVYTYTKDVGVTVQDYILNKENYYKFGTATYPNPK